MHTWHVRFSGCYTDMKKHSVVDVPTHDIEIVTVLRDLSQVQTIIEDNFTLYALARAVMPICDIICNVESVEYVVINPRKDTKYKGAPDAKK